MGNTPPNMSTLIEFPDVGEGEECERQGKTTGKLHRSPKRLRDVPDRARPANYGGSGEIISPDVFSAFCLFCLYCVLVICAERDYSGFSGGAKFAVRGRSGGVWGVVAAFGEAGMGMSNVDNL